MTEYNPGSMPEVRAEWAARQPVLLPLAAAVVPAGSARRTPPLTPVAAHFARLGVSPERIFCWLNDGTEARRSFCVMGMTVIEDKTLPPNTFAVVQAAPRDA